jgi:hypothetical protein
MNAPHAKPRVDHCQEINTFVLGYLRDMMDVMVISACLRDEIARWDGFTRVLHLDMTRPAPDQLRVLLELIGLLTIGEAGAPTSVVDRRGHLRLVTS